MTGRIATRAVCVPLFCVGALAACELAGAPGPAPERTAAASSAVTSCPYAVQPMALNPLLLRHPKVFFAFWGTYWQSGVGATTRAHLESVWSKVASSPVFYNRLAEYQIGLGSYLGSAAITTSLPATGTIDEQQVQAELDSEIASGLLPKPDANTLYMLLLPDGLNDSTDANAFAHHGYAPAAGAVPAVPYAVIPTYGQSGPIVSHEISEAVTDPDVATGYRDPATGNEIGDLCTGTFPVGAAGFAPGPGAIQRMWSQLDCACDTRRDPSSPDFNGDWKADLAVTGGTPGLTSTEIGVALSIGGGSFAPTKLSSTDFATYATRSGATALAGDFDGDGYTDLVAVGVSSWNGVAIAYSHGDGTFGTTVTVATTFGAAASAPGATVVATDINGDGYADLVAAGAPGTTSIAVAFGQPGGGFRVTTAASPFATLVAAPGARFAAGDVNNDGYDDLVAIGTSSTALTVALSNGDGTFSLVNSSSSIVATLAQPGAKLVVGDVDNDSIGDIIVTGAPSATTVVVGHSNGDGTFTAQGPSDGVGTSFPSFAGASGAVLVGGDFDGDMRPDVVATGVSSWTTLPMLAFTQPSNSSYGSYHFGFSDQASDFAGMAGQSSSRVVDGMWYGSASQGGPDGGTDAGPTSCIPQVVSGSVVTQNGNTSVPGPSFSYAAPAAADALLVVRFDGGSGGTPPTAVTYGGQPMTLLTAAADANSGTQQIWTLVGPAAGAHMLAVSTTGANVPYDLEVETFVGVKQNLPIGSVSTVHSSSYSTGYTTSLATQHVNGAMADFLSFGSGDHPGVTVGSGQAESYYLAAAPADSLSSVLPAYVPTTYSQSYTFQWPEAVSSISVEIVSWCE